MALRWPQGDPTPVPAPRGHGEGNEHHRVVVDLHEHVRPKLMFLHPRAPSVPTSIPTAMGMSTSTMELWWTSITMSVPR